MKLLQFFIESIRNAWHSLVAHRLRSILTMLGVGIGIFAITIIFTLVNSLDYNLNRNLSKLGGTVLYVYHWPWTNEGFDWQKYINRPKVDIEDYEGLTRTLSHVEALSYELRIEQQTVKAGQNVVTGVSVRGIKGDYFGINGLSIADGRPFTTPELTGGRPVAIVGHNIAMELIGKSKAAGESFRLKGKQVEIIAVLEKTGAGLFGGSEDDRVFLPYGFTSKAYGQSATFVDKTIAVKVDAPENMNAVENQIVASMRMSRGLRPQEENDFEINKPEMLSSLFSNVSGYLAVGGIIISLFSVIVGGFGIGNIMFAVVKERTFEIGLQKALGAPRRFILFQFLVEAVLLCLFGGVLGLASLYLMLQALQALFTYLQVDFELILSAGNIALGLFISVIIGLISGFIPSLIASRMDPVEAMRF